MSVETVAGEPVHYPKRRDLFKFDEEVASIFDNMAPRSIPLYNEVHRLHVSMLRKRLIPGAVVVDVGSSTGHLFRNIERLLGKKFSDTGIYGVAVDVSPAMMGLLRAEFPTVETICGDITKIPDLSTPADILFCLYTVQFIPDEQKAAAYGWLARNTKLDGALVVGQKDRIDRPPFANDFNEEYYLFRRDNGYSQEEIDAKTAALKNSMWPLPSRATAQYLADCGIEALETSRWLQFSTFLGYRRV